MASAPQVVQPPFYDPPIVDYASGQQHSQAWTEYHQERGGSTGVARGHDAGKSRRDGRVRRGGGTDRRVSSRDDGRRGSREQRGNGCRHAGR